MLLAKFFYRYPANYWRPLALSPAAWALLAYGAVMLIALAVTAVLSANDPRTIREVGVWAKPMKFMAATALFAWTSVWLVKLTDSAFMQHQRFKWLSALIITTSLFEVSYITVQGAQGIASHYNTVNGLYAALFGLMLFAAIGLTFSQAWLAFEIWRTRAAQSASIVTDAVIVGLSLTFVLSTISGFLLGGQQPPAAIGLPIVGWHYDNDLRPAHFLGVHAQQLIPLLGLGAQRYLGQRATVGFISSASLYVLAWCALMALGLAPRALSE